MDKKLPPELQFNFVDESVDPITQEENPNFVHEEEQVNEEISLDLPSIEKDPIDTESIFDSQKKDNLQPIIPETPDVGGLDTEPTAKPKKEKPVKLNKNGKPRKKRVYTEEQKQAMRERLVKARAQVGKGRAKKQEEKAKEQKHKELMKKKRDMEIAEMEKKISQKDTPVPTPKPVKAITKEDIKEAQLEAIMSYDAIRKKRKAKKKEEQMVEQHKQELKNLVKKELGWQHTAGRWSNCY